MNGSGGYAPVTAAGLWGPEGQVGAAFGVAVPSSALGVSPPSEPGSGTGVLVPHDFFRSSGFGLILLLLLVVYFDVRLLNR